MSFDFDTPCDRHGTGSLKFDCAVERGKSPELLPLWVADMDFPCPPAVTNALAARVAHGIFGYTEPDQGYFDAAGSWFEGRFGWRPEREWFVITPGVVFALAAAVNAFTRPGEGVLIQPPVYYPFREVIEDNGRIRVEAPLTRDDATLEYGVDLAAFEQAIVDGNVTLFLLCNPHNPVGRVWSADELAAMGDVCARHGVTVVSDEIHADFTCDGFVHVPFASLGKRYADICVTCTSASKTFNLAGLQVSNTFISNPELRERFRHAVAAAGYSQANTLGLVATRAAYEHGGPWLAELKDYLAENYQMLLDLLAEGAPELRVVERQSTYLVWVDCRALGLTDEGLTRLVEEGALLWLDMGDIFGPSGAGFIRINIACQRATLREACNRLISAVRSR